MARGVAQSCCGDRRGWEGHSKWERGFGMMMGRVWRKDSLTKLLEVGMGLTHFTST